MSDRSKVNGLLGSTLLVSLIEADRWKHPGEDVLSAALPFQGEPVDFLRIEAMRLESRGMLADDPRWSAIFHVVRGRDAVAPVHLPWLDADLAVFIAAYRFPGDDLAIALDYRSSPDDPRVVASGWLPGSAGCVWREVSASFTEFARLLGLCGGV